MKESEEQSNGLKNKIKNHIEKRTQRKKELDDSFMKIVNEFENLKISMYNKSVCEEAVERSIENILSQNLDNYKVPHIDIKSLASKVAQQVLVDLIRYLETKEDDFKFELDCYKKKIEEDFKNKFE